MSNSLVSIIIPTYNRAELLRETLQSVAAQTYQNWECLIIDDGSSDYTSELVSEFTTQNSRFKYFHRPKSYCPGGNGARNYGLDISHGDLINWFDNDDVMLPDFLKQKVEEMESSHHFVISSHKITDERLNVIKEIQLVIKDYILKDYLYWESNFCIVTANVLFRKIFLVQNGYRFNEEIKRGQEAELFSRIFFNAREHDYKVINEFGYLYRQHKDTKTNKSGSFNIEFKKNHTDINTLDLGYAIRLNDKGLVNHILGHILYNLFLSKKHSPEMYRYILEKLSTVFKARLFWEISIPLLSLYLFSPRSSTLDSQLKKYILKYGI